MGLMELYISAYLIGVVGDRAGGFESSLTNKWDEQRKLGGNLVQTGFAGVEL